MSDKGKDKLQEAIQKIDLPGFLTSLGIQIQKQSSKKLYCLCPFCGEKQKLGVTPSGEKKGLWKCYRDTCGYSGNLLTLYAQVKGTDNKEAFKAILKEAGLWEDRQSNVVPIRAKLEGKNRAGQEDLPPWSEGQDGAHSGDGHGEGRGTKAQGDGPADPEASADPEKSNEKSNDIDKDAAGGGSGESGGVRPRDIYTRFVELCPLTEKDRRHLTEYRGFSDATIDTLKFRSGGEHAKAIIEQLRDEFSDLDLKDAGILVEVNGTLVYQNQLLDERLLIPYLDEGGMVYHIRPHKLGFEGIPPEVYCRSLLQKRPKRVVLTEGEFKTAALYQHGIDSVASPGTGILSNKYFDRLAQTLKEFGVEEVIIGYDNEIKDDPKYSNYKEEPEKRYDTQYWCYIMAYKLGKNNVCDFRTKIAWMPDEWRQNGKADWDSALAAGKSKDDFSRVIEKAVTPKEFLASFEGEAERVIRRKINYHFNSGKIPVKREFNRYLATKNKGRENEYEAPVSNFVIDIKSTLFTPDGAIRNVQMVNEYGERSDIFTLNPSEMAGLSNWKTFCFGKGNYIFQGDGNDLTNIWRLEFLRDDGALIYSPEMIGHIEKDIWLFGNAAVTTKDGKVYTPDNNGTFWIRDRGYAPKSLSVSAKTGFVEDTIPRISTKPVDLVDVSQKIRQTVGGYEAYMCIGWVIATIFSKEIFGAYKCVPILFLHGMREGGKSTVMRWAMNLFGIDTEGISIGKTTTANYVARALSYHGSLGCWFDEYRNETGVIEKDGLLRSAYNRQVSGKGTATAFQTKGFAVNASVAISGEELPKDNGLFTRLVPLQISAYKRDRTWFEWINRKSSDFSYLTYYLLTNYEKLKPKIMQTIAELKEALIDEDVSDRTAENWAICAGAFDAVIEQDSEFVEWVAENCKEIKRTGEQDHMLNQFWADISFLITEKKIAENYIRVMPGNVLAVRIHQVYQIWALHYRSKTGREPFAEQSIYNYLKDQPYFLEHTRAYFGSGSNQADRKRAVLIDMNKAPEVVQEIVEELD